MACVQVLIHNSTYLFTQHHVVLLSCKPSQSLQYKHFTPLYTIIHHHTFMHYPIHSYILQYTHAYTRTRKYHNKQQMSTLIYITCSSFFHHSSFMHCLCMLNKGYTRIFRITINVDTSAFIHH